MITEEQIRFCERMNSGLRRELISALMKSIGINEEETTIINQQERVGTRLTESEKEILDSFSIPDIEELRREDLPEIIRAAKGEGARENLSEKQETAIVTLTEQFKTNLVKIVERMLGIKHSDIATKKPETRVEVPPIEQPKEPIREGTPLEINDRRMLSAFNIFTTEELSTIRKEDLPEIIRIAKGEGGRKNLTADETRKIFSLPIETKKQLIHIIEEMLGITHEETPIIQPQQPTELPPIEQPAQPQITPQEPLTTHEFIGTKLNPQQKAVLASVFVGNEGFPDIDTVAQEDLPEIVQELDEVIKQRT